MCCDIDNLEVMTEPYALLCALRRMLCSGDDLEALIEALERRGAREGGLYASLLRCREAVLRAMPAGERRREVRMSAEALKHSNLFGSAAGWPAGRVWCTALARPFCL